MKKPVPHIYKLALLLFLVVTLQYTHAQNEFYNNGSGVTVQPGALVFIQGEVINTNAGPNIGLITNSGLISLSGNWTNNSTSGALAPTTGSVELTGGNESINGTQPTRFNNLTLLGSGVKTLNVNTFVSGATGVLAVMARPLDLNSNTLFVTNPLPGAVTRTTGYIISETPAVPGYGIIQWLIGNSAAGSYVFPFGSLAANYIPLTLNITAPGAQSTTGAISVSTYPTVTTPAINNRPLPTGVANLNNNCATEHAPKMLDRFWVINTSNYNTNPVANKQFTYIENEWDLTGGSTNAIIESDLQAWYYNAGWTHLASANNSATNNETITGNSNYGVFTLGDYKKLDLQLLDVDSVVCFGESNGVITFTSNVGYGSPTYSLNSTAITTFTVNTLAAGTYSIVGMDIMGCKDTISTILVDQPDKLLLTIASDKNTICKNDIVVLTSVFSGGIKPYNVAWSTGVNDSGISTNSLTQLAMPQSPTKYWVGLTDKNNCVVHSDTIDVNVNPLPIIDFSADPTNDCQPLIVNFTNLSAPTPSVSSWLWSFGTGDASTVKSPTYIYKNPGTFTVSLTAVSDKGCKNTSTKPDYILVHPKPKANFNFTPPTGTDFLNPEVAFHNTSAGYDNAAWNLGDGTLTGDVNPTHTYADTGSYLVKLVVSTLYNCEDNVSMLVKVNEISTLYVPNAFTPDGNSLNDLFVPVSIELYDFKMMIFDRWGEKIFESAITNEGWNGKYKGATCEEGVYVYKIEYKAMNGPVKRRTQTMVGHVTLLHTAR